MRYIMLLLFYLVLLAFVIVCLGCHDDTTWNEPTFEIFRTDATVRYADNSYDLYTDIENTTIEIPREARLLTISMQIDSDLYVASQHIAIHDINNVYYIGATGTNEPAFRPGEITANFTVMFYYGTPEVRVYRDDEYIIYLWLKSVGGRESTYIAFNIKFIE